MGPKNGLNVPQKVFKIYTEMRGRTLIEIRRISRQGYGENIRSSQIFETFFWKPIKEIFDVRERVMTS